MNGNSFVIVRYLNSHPCRQWFNNVSLLISELPLLWSITRSTVSFLISTLTVYMQSTRDRFVSAYNIIGGSNRRTAPYRYHALRRCWFSDYNKPVFFAVSVKRSSCVANFHPTFWARNRVWAKKMWINKWYLQRQREIRVRQRTITSRNKLVLVNKFIIEPISQKNNNFASNFRKYLLFNVKRDYEEMLSKFFFSFKTPVRILR